MPGYLKRTNIRKRLLIFAFQMSHKKIENMYQRLNLLEKKCNYCLKTAIPITVFKGGKIYEKCQNCRTLKQIGTIATLFCKEHC